MNAIEELKNNYLLAKQYYENLSLMNTSKDQALNLEQMIEFEKSYKEKLLSKKQLAIGLSRV